MAAYLKIALPVAIAYLGMTPQQFYAMTPLEFTRGVQGWEARWRRDAELQCWKLSHIMGATMGRKGPTPKRLIKALLGPQRHKGPVTEEDRQLAREELRKLSGPNKKQNPKETAAGLFEDMKSRGLVRSRNGC